MSNETFCGTSNEVYVNFFDEGIYVCAKCENPLFHSTAKFQHDSPWPAFNSTVNSDSVAKEADGFAYYVRCGKCMSGLGHEFLGDGPDGSSRF